MKTIFFKNKPSILETYSVVGPKESQSPLKKCFDLKIDDDKFNELTYEKAERKMLITAISNLLKKVNVNENELDVMLLGDLLNQNISTSFTAREFDASLLGLYSACSSITESLLLGATLIDGNYINNAVCATVSHFSTAERQYRYPRELGSTRPPQAQWTVTGAGAFYLSNDKNYPKIVNATIGKVVDFGVTDVNNMGAAMAPACAETIINHLKNTNTTPYDYDLIVSGDLGALGSRILKHLTNERGVDIKSNHVDCGELIYNIDELEFQGGSGAGCSAVVMASYIYPKLLKKEINRVLFCATGALLSTVSSQQGESIPCISHAVTLENYD